MARVYDDLRKPVNQSRGLRNVKRQLRLEGAPTLRNDDYRSLARACFYS